MANDLRSRLGEIINRTVAEVELAVRESLARDVLQGANGRPPSTQPRTATPAAAPRGGGRRRGVASGDIQRVLSVISKNPGLRTEEIYSQSGLPSKLVKRVLAKLRATGSVRTSGEKRGTTYKVAGGAGGAAATTAAAPKGRAAAPRKPPKPARATATRGAARKGPPKGTKVRRISDAELSTVLSVLNKSPGLTSVQIQKEAGIDAKEAARVLLKLRKTGKVTWKGERSAATYALA